ncbi:MAG TPA: hypothetical protein VFF27_13555 [Bacteroidia bacterium]|jgi:hypothetical protein|nr:hypothetical protein [Bacteroidia bacterium]
MSIQRFLFFLFFVCIVSCEAPLVTFELPQPLEAKDQPRFPKNLIGKYLSTLDSSIITITDSVISRGFNIKFVMCKKELDTMKQCVLQADTLFNKLTNEKICIINIRDTLYTPFHLQDTLFFISEKGILRKDKGYYFLNMKYREGWEVQKLEFAKGKLNLCSISDIAEIEDLKQITENATDSSLQFNPDKKQFRKFIKSKGFSKKEEFIKLK